MIKTLINYKGSCVICGSILHGYQRKYCSKCKTTKPKDLDYFVNYHKNKLIYNKFTQKNEKYTGEPAPDGLVRHHIYYDLLDINLGIVFITQSEHMKIHQDIKFGRTKSIPIYANWRNSNFKSDLWKS